MKGDLYVDLIELKRVHLQIGGTSVQSKLAFIFKKVAEKASDPIVV
jgi:hypothetical protein